MPESTHSAVVRGRQEALLAHVAQAFGWDMPEAGKALDARFFPPQDWLQGVQQAWRSGTPSPREALEHKIFDGAAADTVKRHDPAIMRMADAMVEEYLLTYYWECQAQAGMVRGEEAAYRQGNAAEAVRAQTSAHYANQLLEQGYQTAEVDKIIRSVNGCFMKFMETQFSMAEGFPRPGISPKREPDTEPATCVTDIQLYAEKKYQRMHRQADHER